MWFYIVLLFMLIISFLVWIVRTVEEKYFNIKKADLFLEDVLEVRRMEKNYLLYLGNKSMEEWDF